MTTLTPQLFLPEISDGEDKSCAFINCLRNQYRHLRKWAKRTITDTFRLYDREIAAYPIAIDFYAGRFCIHYFAAHKQSEAPPLELVKAVFNALHKLFGTKPDDIYWRTRAKAKPTRQHEKMANTQQFFTVLEYGVKFNVNLRDYLDTGLFLDHRETRRLVASESKGKRVLNLFAYTCAFSVHAAIAGAVFTKSVDISNTYTAWGETNFRLNGFSLKNHPIIRADCLRFLTQEFISQERYDLIIVDPPTISRSKKMERLFDIQVDYAELLLKALRLLTPSGELFFSSNARKLCFDGNYFPNYAIVEISEKTVPIDFKDRKIHRCWKFSSR